MIHWLYNHVSPFRKSVNKLLHSQQVVVPNTEFVCIAPNGKRLLRYANDLDLPMVRKGVINELMTKLTIAITDKELGEYLSVLKACHQELLTAGKLVSKPFSIIGYYLTELEERKSLGIHPELCFDLCAVVYFFEDEKLTNSYDWTLHNQKVELFKQWSMSGEFDFFLQRGWQEYLPYSNTSPQGLKSYVSSIKPTLEAQRKMRSSLMEQLGLSNAVSAS